MLKLNEINLNNKFPDLMKPISQQDFDRYMELAYKKISQAGPSCNGQKLLYFTREWKGGECPHCGLLYKKNDGNNIHTFVYYSPQCDCIKRIEFHTEMRRVWKTMNIPDSYIDVSLDTWDSGNIVPDETSKARDKVLTYAAQKERSPGIVLHGSPGTGKTHCAVGLLKHEYFKGKKGLYVKMADIVARIINGENEYIDELLTSDILLLDDIDKVNLKNEWTEQQIFRLLDTIINDNKQFIATTNAVSKTKFAALFSEATASRLVNNCFVKFTGRDYRVVKNNYKE